MSEDLKPCEDCAKKHKENLRLKRKIRKLEKGIADVEQQRRRNIPLCGPGSYDE